MRISSSVPTIKKLFALSGNICAFPGCKQRIIDEYGNLIGEICHIEAANLGGERFNPSQSEHERAAFENLIIFCANHHLVTDNVSLFTVEKLKEMKKLHEEHNQKNQYSISQSEIIAIVSSIDQKLANLASTTAYEKTPYRMKLEISTSIPGYPIPGQTGLRPGPPCLSIKGMNIGDRSVSISSWGFKLPDKTYLTKNPDFFPIRFPYEIKPGKSLFVWMEYQEIVGILKGKGYSGTIILEGFFRDEINNKWEEECASFDIDEYG
jgi:hypothetical protein